MTDETYHRNIFFIGGAPRSGTTVAHALVCTSSHMCAYHPEISYVTPFFLAYSVGQENWDNHTSAFFAEREHFRLHIYNLINQAFNHIYNVLNKPELLCVKDPHLTPLFPAVLDLLGDRARFMTVIRHPYDVVRSRQEVAARSKEAFSAQNALAVAQKYMEFYQHINNPSFGDRLMYFRYEDLLSNEVQSRIKAFTGCDDISSENIWAESKMTQSQLAGSAMKDPWFSPKYHGSIDLASRLSPLEKQFRVITNEICAPMMERFGYAVEK